MVGFASTEHFIGGKRMSIGTIKRWFFWGWLLFFIGLTMTLIVALFSFWDTMQPYRHYLLGLWNGGVKFILSPVVWLVFGITGLLLIAVKRVRTRALEQGYKLKIVPVQKIGDYPHYQHQAYIQVENVGTGKLTCVARLLQVTKVNLDAEERYRRIDVNELNPNGRYLGWGRNATWFEKLDESSPPTLVHLVDSAQGQRAKFLFAEFEESPPIAGGVYRVHVEFLRWKDGRYVKFSELEETLLVADDGLVWAKNYGEQNGNE